ncbi:hypothetical protein OGAPHI_000730 [Ogataea philodendri]|uniref:Uncharacterized protein n=1 Tax=Ogataea philodendri TaxID=1378263 RepID=A0A9P8PGH7_9ASCO|nr:uncharacterized protein OGAPHI_000730 [Ogataea philodendri]KAH3671019.1 hypothetical protein OGAPHI_000730 [Ogataea philodendri]
MLRTKIEKLSCLLGRGLSKLGSGVFSASLPSSFAASSSSSSLLSSCADCSSSSDSSPPLSASDCSSSLSLSLSLSCSRWKSSHLLLSIAKSTATSLPWILSPADSCTAFAAAEWRIIVTNPNPVILPPFLRGMCASFTLPYFRNSFTRSFGSRTDHGRFLTISLALFFIATSCDLARGSTVSFAALSFLTLRFAIETLSSLSLNLFFFESFKAFSASSSVTNETNPNPRLFPSLSFTITECRTGANCEKKSFNSSFVPLGATFCTNSVLLSNPSSLDVDPGRSDILKLFRTVPAKSI